MTESERDAGGVLTDLISPEDQRSIYSALHSSSLPARSLALYSRWWQIETWLRQLAYVELRAHYGINWTDVVKIAFARQAQDAAYTHMTGPDNENPLAYLDYSQLLDIIGKHWQLFSYALIERKSWDGRQEELKRIRHRISHVRTPHDDDLGRVEQTLRDLELGAYKALASYNRRAQPDPNVHRDPVSIGWIDQQHATARRLIAHAEQQYETSLRLSVSMRPWASWPGNFESASGLLWHADFYMRDRTIDIARLWRDSSLRRVRPLLVHLLADSPADVSFTFSGADDAGAIADGIGQAFDAVLMVSRHGTADWVGERDARRLFVRGIDYRVEYGGAWSIVDDTTVPISIFGAGGGVFEIPEW